jgi:hypothetical protein
MAATNGAGTRIVNADLWLAFSARVIAQPIALKAASGVDPATGPAWSLPPYA